MFSWITLQMKSTPQIYIQSLWSYFGSLNFLHITELPSAGTLFLYPSLPRNVTWILISQDLNHFFFETFSEVSDKLRCPCYILAQKECIFLSNIYIWILIYAFIFKTIIWDSILCLPIPFYLFKSGKNSIHN